MKLKQYFGVGLWLVASGLMGVGLLIDHSTLNTVGAIVGGIYILFLIFSLARHAPFANELPTFEPLVRLHWSYRTMLWFIILVATAAFVVSGILLQNGWLMLIACVVLSLALIIRYNRLVTRRMVGVGIIIGVFLSLIEMLLEANLIMPLMAIPMAVCGLMLLSHTQLTRFWAFNGRFTQSIHSFIKGCVLALPPGLLNIVLAQGSEQSAFDSQFKHWWQAFYAFQPGLLEEIWGRLFLTTLFYGLLRSTNDNKPKQSLYAAIFIATLLHGLAHYPQSIEGIPATIFISIMYGLPLAFLYVKRDFEHAVAYHFFIDFLRFLFSALG